ncbi:hypothetical protein BDF20DRAFT_901781 [Mycotypha africana]|uniref:uncharacterized protein n=1 Tax=Mycotypha africana TaxID=64632 RepID=UPI00230053F8|nr:uncharacterized protein BDF20DRAFT_901781 [Mycotypha africana]KAI8967313.1 hypothetical protein BDF20DRAFT_901781 [Mycotypha africana]
MRIVLTFTLFAILTMILLEDISASHIDIHSTNQLNIKQRKLLNKRRLNRPTLFKRQNPAYNTFPSSTGQPGQSGQQQPGQPGQQSAAPPCPDPQNPNCPQPAQSLSLPVLVPNLVVPPATTLPGLSLPATPKQLVGLPAVPGLPGVPAVPSLPTLPGLPPPAILPPMPDLSTVAPPAGDEDAD